MKACSRKEARSGAAVRSALGAAVVAVSLLCGCSGGPLNVSFEAERAAWKATRLEQRLSLRPDGSPAAVAPVIAAYEKVLARYPVSAAGSDAELRRSVVRSRVLAARRLASLRFASGERNKAVRVLWDARSEAATDPAAGVVLYGDLTQVLARGSSADSLADVCKEMYETLPAAQPDGSPIPAVLKAPVDRIAAYASAGRTAEATAALDDALSYYDRVSTEHPGTATEVVSLMHKAEVLNRVRRTPEAISTLERTRTLPAVREYAASIAFLLGELLEQQNTDLAGAERQYREVCENHADSPLAPQAGIRLARVQASTGRPDSALATLDRVARNSERDPDGASQARFQKGLILAANRRPDEATRELRSVAADFPRTRAGLLAPIQIAQFYRASGDSLSMKATLREAGQGYEQLIRDLGPDARQASLVSEALDRLADVRLALRDWEGLSQLLQDRAASFPKDQRSPSALASAAQILEQKLRDRQGSLRVLQKLVDSYPNHPLARPARDKIAQLGGSSGS